jgi:hypothetical protein
MMNSNSKSSSAVKVTYNGEPVGYVLVEHIMFVPNNDDSYNPKNNNEYEDWHKTISALDSDYIKTELIDKGDIDYHAVNEMSFKIEKDREVGGYLTYETRDDLGLVKKRHDSIILDHEYPYRKIKGRSITTTTAAD